MWTSSQSSTAARPDPSTIRLPIRKSPCTSLGGVGGGRWAASHRNAHSNVAVVSPISSSRLRHSVSCSVCSRPIPSGSARWMAASACAHCSSSRVAPRVVERAVDAPDDRLAADHVADQVRIAQRGRRIVGGEDVGDGCSCGRGALLHACLQLHARVHIVGWSCAQDQRLAAVLTDGVEGPRGAARPAGQGGEVLDAHLAEDRRKNFCQLLFHLRPNPKSRCATRRIWISSAPSVMR